MTIVKIVLWLRYKKKVFIFRLISYVTTYFSKMSVSFNFLVQIEKESISYKILISNFVYEIIELLRSNTRNQPNPIKKLSWKQ